ncbi:MAG: hypothetical protein ACN6PX_14465 [Stenotrophomonas lactitubi]
MTDGTGTSGACRRPRLPSALRLLAVAALAWHARRQRSNAL